MTIDGPAEPTGIETALHELLRRSYGLFPDELGSVTAEIVLEHTSAADVQLLLVDLDQSVLTSLDGKTVHPVDFGPPGQAYRNQQPVRERTAQGTWLWVPVLDSAERMGVLGVLDGEDVALDGWISLASLLGELVASKDGYGDHIARLQRQKPTSIAAEMRWSLLPPLTFTSSRVGISGILQPSYGLAGDVFDYALSSQHATVAVFDAMGHGLQASRLANLAVGTYRAGRRAGIGGQELLGSIDETIADQFGHPLFVTGQLLELDLETGLARVYTAGHPPCAVFPLEGQPRYLDVTPGVPLGLGPSTYEPTEVQLEPGDALLLISDGVYEARDADGSSYGFERILAVVQDRLAAGDSAPEVLRRAIRDVMDFQAGELRDDTTMAIVRWRPEVVGLPEPPTAAGLQEAEPA